MFDSKVSPAGKQASDWSVLCAVCPQGACFHASVWPVSWIKLTARSSVLISAPLINTSCCTAKVWRLFIIYSHRPDECPFTPHQTSTGCGWTVWFSCRSRSTNSDHTHSEHSQWVINSSVHLSAVFCVKNWNHVLMCWSLIRLLYPGE